MLMATLLTLTAVWLADLAAIERQPAPPPVEINSQVFYIPINMDAGMRESTARIRLFASMDRGRTWKVMQEGHAEQEMMVFRASKDGEYWFTIQVINKVGKKFPEDVAEAPPGLRVLVRSGEAPAASQDTLPSNPLSSKETDPLEALEKFISTYHASPAPEQARRFLAIALTERILQHPVVKTKPHARTLLAHGFGHMARREPQLIRDMESHFAAASPAGKEFLLECLRVCGDGETIKCLVIWREIPRNSSLRSSLDSVRRFLEAPARKLPRNLPAKTPEEVDLLWADFFVTGDYEPVARILDILDQPADEPTPLQKVTAWSLWSNVEQHPWLGTMLAAREADRPTTTRRLIREWQETKATKVKTK